MPREQAGWVVAASADNAAATATKAAASGRQHVVYAVDASFSNGATAANKLLQIRSGSTVVWEGYVTGSRAVEFPAGLAIAPGAAASAELAASGTGGALGKVNLHGVTA